MGLTQLAWLSVAHQKTLIWFPELASPKLAVLALSHRQHHILCTIDGWLCKDAQCRGVPRVGQDLMAPVMVRRSPWGEHLPVGEIQPRLVVQPTATLLTVALSASHELACTSCQGLQPGQAVFHDKNETFHPQTMITASHSAECRQGALCKEVEILSGETAAQAAGTQP